MTQCITPVFKCNGWKITTVEGLGSTRSGLGELQQRLNDNAGTQCGFCTPGMIMSMNRYTLRCIQGKRLQVFKKYLS